MDWSSAGLWDGVKKAGKIALWVAVSGAIAALAAEIKGYETTNHDVMIGLGIMVANALIAGAQRWLATKKVK